MRRCWANAAGMGPTPPSAEGQHEVGQRAGASAECHAGRAAGVRPTEERRRGREPACEPNGRCKGLRQEHAWPALGRAGRPQRGCGPHGQQAMDQTVGVGGLCYWLGGVPQGTLPESSGYQSVE